jgi:hypothetical protein
LRWDIIKIGYIIPEGEKEHNITKDVVIAKQNED